MGADSDGVQRAVIAGTAVVGALADRAADRLICFVHRFIPPNQVCTLILSAVRPFYTSKNWFFKNR